MPKFKSRKERILKGTKRLKELGKIDIITAHDIILYPIRTKKSMRLIEQTNTLTFACKSFANKMEIRQAFESVYNTDAIKVNTYNHRDGYKKAYIRCKEDGDAMEVATKHDFI